MASSQQYSPDQVLAMGRNAEAAGNLDYALKVYAYLVEHFAELPEATDARHGQQRIIAWQRAELARRGGGGDGDQGHGPGASGADRTGVQPPPLRADAGRGEAMADVSRQRPPPLSNRLDALRSPLPQEHGPRGQPARSGPAPQGARGVMPPQRGPAPAGPVQHGSGLQAPPRQGQPNHGHPPNEGHYDQGLVASRKGAIDEHAARSTGLVPAEPGLPRMIARSAAEQEDDIAYEPYRRYRVGSFLASCMAVLGWFAVLAGLVLLAAMLSGLGSGAVPALGRPGAFGLSLGSEIGAAALIAGLLTVLVSQIAHAVFDQANASLAMLEIEQSRGDY